MHHTCLRQCLLGLLPKGGAFDGTSAFEAFNFLTNLALRPLPAHSILGLPTAPLPLVVFMRK